MWCHETLLHILNAALELVFGEFVALGQTQVVLFFDEVHSKQMELLFLMFVFLCHLQNLRVEAHINDTVSLCKTHRKSDCLKIRCLKG